MVLRSVSAGARALRKRKTRESCAVKVRRGLKRAGGAPSAAEETISVQRQKAAGDCGCFVPMTRDRGLSMESFEISPRSRSKVEDPAFAGVQGRRRSNLTLRTFHLAQVIRLFSLLTLDLGL